MGLQLRAGCDCGDLRDDARRSAPACRAGVRAQALHEPDADARRATIDWHALVEHQRAARESDDLAAVGPVPDPVGGAVDEARRADAGAVPLYALGRRSIAGRWHLRHQRARERVGVVLARGLVGYPRTCAGIGPPQARHRRMAHHARDRGRATVSAKLLTIDEVAARLRIA